MEHQNIEVVQNYLQAVYRGDIATATQLLTDDVRLFMTGQNQLTGHYQGRDAFFAAFGRMMDISQGTYQLVEQQDWLVSASRVILLAVEQVTKDGQQVNFDRAVVYEIRNERIAAVRIYEGNTAEADFAFG